jgi:hypothetical protein
MRAVRAIPVEMKIMLQVITGLALLVSAPAHAIVGGGAPSAQGVGRSIVTIVGSRGNFCTGALIAPSLVLTAAHCVQPGATYKIVEYGVDRQPQLQDVKSVAIHPGFNMQAMTAHRATADVALLQLEVAPKGKNPATLGVPQVPIVVGSRFTIAGIGVTIRGEGSSGGTIRVAGLVAAAGQAACRFASSTRPDRVLATGLARVPGIPAAPYSRIGRTVPSSSASSAGRPEQTAPRAAAV